MNGSRRGLVLGEVAAVMLVGAVAACLLAVAGQDVRAGASRKKCEANLRDLGRASFSYSTDYQDRFPTFSWRKDRISTMYQDLGAAAAEAKNDAERAALQAADILRRRTKSETWNAPADWLPHLRYSTLVIQDYFGPERPAFLVCPNDDPLIELRKDGSDRAPETATTVADVARFRSSYELPPAVYDRAQQTWGTRLANEAVRLRQGRTEREFLVGSETSLTAGRMADVSFPSQRAMWYEAHDAHQGDAWRLFADADAKPGMTIMDGSVRAIEGREVNLGWNPSNAAADEAAIIVDEPAPGERPDNAAALIETRHWGRVRWTRGGLRGVDFSAGEIETGNTRPAPKGERPSAEPNAAGAGDALLAR